LILLLVTKCHGVDLVAVAAGDLVLERLRRSGIRPVDLARLLGLKDSAASRILSGTRGIPTWHLDAIAKHLQISVPSLFQPLDEGEPQPYLTSFEARAWRFCDDAHRQAAVTILRLGRRRSDASPPRPLERERRAERLQEFVRKDPRQDEAPV
jgi:hypothetical protein